jgi:hypothetical protein
MSFSEFLSRLDPASVIFGMILTTVIVLIIGWLNDIKNGPDDGPMEQAAPVWIPVGPGHVTILRLPLRMDQAKNMIRHYSRGGELTARELKAIGLSQLDYEKVRKELLDRDLVTLGAKDKMLPLPPLKNYLATEYDTVIRTERYKR